MKKILVTGGLGFIGSHTVVELLASGYEVFIIDDLSNTRIEVLDRIFEITNKKPTFFNIDLKNKELLKEFFRKNKVEGVIHFAAYKAVGESVEKPLTYYENNISSLVYLLQEIEIHSIKNFIFSSSCTVYGQADELPISENAPVKKATSPYGNTKQIGEAIIQDTTNAGDLRAIALRYFNPIGAHDSHLIGELPLGVPQNLIPFVVQTALGIREKLTVFGDDYDTPDGTAVRDYIHVVDLAKAHIVALERLTNEQHKENFEVFNVGTGKGTSVKEVIKTFEKVTGLQLNYTIGTRRQGDIVAAFSNTSMANKELKWKAQKTLEEAVLDAFEFQKKEK
jgi:UDP-glucose 4-epimerase